GCLMSCYQDGVFEQCGCMDPRYGRPDKISPCHASRASCVLNITQRRGDPSTWTECKCPQPCNE
ncbi:Protein EGAS-4, partial [Aphelenchoides avenae]